MGANALGAVVAHDAVNRLVIPGDLSSDNATLEWDRGDGGGALSQRRGRLFDDRCHLHRPGGGRILQPRRGRRRVLQTQPGPHGEFQYLHSVTDYPEVVATSYGQSQDTFGGDASELAFRYDTRNWFVDLSGRYMGEGFRADAGFVSQVNERRVQTMIERRFWGGDEDFYTVLSINGGGWHKENTEGRLIGEGIWTSFNIQGPLQSEFWVNPNFRRQFFDGEANSIFQLWFGGSLRPSGALQFDMFGNVGTETDFTNGGKAKGIRLNPTVNLRLGRKVALRFGHTYQRLETLAGEGILRANLSQFRAVYNFSPRSFVRAIVQYRDTDRDPETHEDEVNRSASAVFTQLLFSYKMNPQTVVFLGYTDNRDAFTDQEFNRVGLTQSDRTLFLKLGYAVRP